MKVNKLSSTQIRDRLSKNSSDEKALRTTIKQAMKRLDEQENKPPFTYPIKK